MNANQIINMVLRLFLRKAVGQGINMAARRGQNQNSAEMTPEERRQARQARQAAKRARQTAKMMRRM